jgi:hypothetical protein
MISPTVGKLYQAAAKPMPPATSTLAKSKEARTVRERQGSSTSSAQVRAASSRTASRSTLPEKKRAGGSLSPKSGQRRPTAPTDEATTTSNRFDVLNVDEFVGDPGSVDRGPPPDTVNEKVVVIKSGDSKMKIKPITAP